MAWWVSNDKDILNTTVQDDEVWNSRTVRTWLNTQLLRDNVVDLIGYMLVYQVTSKMPGGGHKYPKPGNLDATSFIGGVDSDGFLPQESNRLKDPALDIMSSTMRKNLWRHANDTITPVQSNF